MLLGVGPNGRQLRRPGGVDGGGFRDKMDPINMTNCSGGFYGGNSERTAPAMAREFVQPSMNPIRLPCLIL